MAPAETITNLLRAVCLFVLCGESTKYETPETFPRWSTSMRSAIAPVTRLQLPVASARGMTVLWEPLFASVGQAKPTQYLQAMHAERP